MMEAVSNFSVLSGLGLGLGGFGGFGVWGFSWGFGVVGLGVFGVSGIVAFRSGHCFYWV